MFLKATKHSASINTQVAAMHVYESERAIFALSADILYGPVQSILTPLFKALEHALSIDSHTFAEAAESRPLASERAISRKFLPPASEIKEPSNLYSAPPPDNFFSFSRTSGIVPAGSETKADLNTGASKPDILRI